MMQRVGCGHKENTFKIHWMNWERMGVAKSKGGLGFRDLVMFNKALLAKQMWRLLIKPNSLVAQILKAKYFHNCTVPEATVGARPSYAWRSLMASQALLKKWAIMDDRGWARYQDLGNTLDSNSNVFFCAVARVKDLIDQNTKWWNRSLISTTFLEEEAKVILNIPLSPLQPRDRLIWRCTTTGEFTVRSAYHMGMEMAASLCSGGSNAGRAHEYGRCAGC